MVVLLCCLFFVVVWCRIFVVVPEVGVLHHVDGCSQVVVRITFGIQFEIHGDLLARFESDHYHVLIFLVVVVIGHFTGVKRDDMILKYFVLTFRNSRYDKWVYSIFFIMILFL